MRTIVPFNGDAFALFKKFAGLSGAFFLDTSLRVKDQSYSFMGANPKAVLTGRSLQELRPLLAYQRKTGDKLVGFITYEGAFHFGSYPCWARLDHKARTLELNAPDQHSMCQLKDLVINGPIRVPVLKPCRIVSRSNFNQAAYMAAIRKALAAIKRGDFYQVNLSRCVDVLAAVDPLLLYGALRGYSPAPFAAYYDAGTSTILSSSPEMFLKVRGDQVEVRPMKGTRPRGMTPAADARYYQDLKQSRKEIAELLMVTDLERNDLGRVCRWGSVEVAMLRQIERYPTVFQATASVEGRLKPGIDAVELLKAVFPSGSVTGTPKIAAMDFIRKIEGVPRGFYTGALGQIDPDGSRDFNVLIRSIEVKPGRLRYHVGGGIVADSNPKAEYDETILKAAAIERAIKEAAGTHN